MEFLLCISLLAVSGIIFAAPVLIVALQRRARQSSLLRRILTVTLSSIVFALLMLILTIFSIPLSMVGYAPASPALENELMTQFLIPPIFDSSELCFSADDSVCSRATQVLNENHDIPTYLLKLVVALIPALSCGFTVHYVTHDKRKSKV